MPPLQSKQDAMWLPYGDAMRVLAMVAVITIHVASGEFATMPLNTTTWWVVSGVNAISRWCVPLFIMLSGALLLDPDRVYSLGSFYKKRLLRVGVPLAFWTVVYLLWTAWFKGQDMSPHSIAYALWLGKPYYHLPFMFALCGLYVITPFLRILVQHASRPELWGLTLFSIFLAVFPGLVGQFGRGTPSSPIGILMFLPYIGYFLLGSLMRGQGLEPKPVGWVASGFFVVVGCIIVGTWVISGGADGGLLNLYLQHYLSPSVVIMSIFAFLWISRSSIVRRADQEPGSGSLLARHLAPASLGVYLLHPIVLDLLQAAGLRYDTYGVFVGLPLTLAVTVVLTFTVVSLFRKVRVMRWVLG